MQVTINFNQIYPPLKLVDTLIEMTFEAPQIDGSMQEILIIIAPHPDPLLANVFNLGFGPTNGKGGFEDNVKLRHLNLNKVFSTVLFLGLTFLQLTVGIDGSDGFRARLYHRMYKYNREYLSNYFTAIGVDWYVRIFRDGRYEQDIDGYYIAKPKPEPFDNERTRHDLYRYYMFTLNKADLTLN